MLQNPAQRYEKEMKTNEKIITKYRQYLKLEKSLSENTIQAYLTDLDKLLAYFTLEGIDCTEATLQDLENFSAGLHDIGIHPRSQARILSGIRSFYRFLTLDDYIRQDPSELLESPQIGKHLPDILTVEEIDALIGAIDQGTPEGQRNRAILETLYSCGLRVSELCNLRLSDLYLSEGFIKVEGKGNKQRLVPISPRAVNELKNYFVEREETKIRPGYEDFVFISRIGKNISRIMVFHIIKELADQIGLKKNISPPYFPPLVRHPSARRRCQPACHPVYAGTRKHRHHRDLYPHRPQYVAARNHRTPPTEQEKAIRVSTFAPF